MNKSNINDFLTKTLSVYTLLLFIIVILKLVGLDYFGIDVNNPILLKIDQFCYKFNLTNIIYIITLYINVFVIYSITLKENSKELKLYLILVILFYIIIKIIENKYINIPIAVIVEFVYMYVMLKIYNKQSSFKRYLLVSLLLIVYQFITLFIRNINYIENNSFILNTILSVDYILLQLITYEIFKKGGIRLCGMEVHSYLQKKQHLKTLLKKLQRNLDNFKKKTRVEKLEISIFIVLSLIWNTLSVVLILFVAKLNDTLIECIFILTSFWLSKTTFGKPFHFSKMSTCFVVSNLTYYALNRITTPLGISIIVPIILGVGLSYVTSKFVKPSATKLYKGMTEDDFNNSILNVTDKDSLQYKICHMFYVERKSELEIAHNVGYSIDNIKKIKAKINKKIKELD